MLQTTDKPKPDLRRVLDDLDNEAAGLRTIESLLFQIINEHSTREPFTDREHEQMCWLVTQLDEYQRAHPKSFRREPAGGGVMKPLTRRSVMVGSAAAMTAIPALALPVVARETPIEKIKRLGKDLEQAMLEAYGPGELRTCRWGPHSDKPEQQGLEGPPVYMVVVHPEQGA